MVEQLEDSRRRLVNGADDAFVLMRQISEEFDGVSGGHFIQTTGGLVQEKN